MSKFFIQLRYFSKTHFFHFFILALIFLLALFLRLHNLELAISFDSDISRHFLVAKHILTDHDSDFFVAPYADAGSGYLNNSPVYYWYRSLLYQQGANTIFGSAKLSVLVDCVSLIAVYGIGCLLLNRYFGSLLGLIFAIHPMLIQYSQNSFQPYFLIPFLLFSIFFLLWAVKQKSMLSLCLSWLFLFWATNIHLAALTLVMPFAVFSLIFLFQLQSKTHKIHLLNSLIFLVEMLFIFAKLTSFSLQNFAGWIRMLYQPSNSAQTDPNLTRNLTYKITNLMHQILGIGSTWNQQFTPIELILIWILTLLLITSSLIFLFKAFKKKKLTLQSIISLLFLTLFLTLVTKEYQDWYAVCQVVVGIILLPYLVIVGTRHFFKSNLRKNIIVTAFLSLGIVGFLSLTTNHYLRNNISPTNMTLYQDTAQAILQNLQQQEPTIPIKEIADKIMIIDRTGYGLFYDRASFWYFLERNSGANLSRVCSSSEICPRVRSPQYYYFICQSAESNCYQHIFAYNKPNDAESLIKFTLLSPSLMPPNQPSLQKIELSSNAASQIQVWMVSE